MKRFSFIPLTLGLATLVIFAGVGCSFGTPTTESDLDAELDALLEELEEYEPEEDLYAFTDETDVEAFICDEAFETCFDGTIDFLDEEVILMTNEDGEYEDVYDSECDDTGYCEVETSYGYIYFIQAY